MMGVGIRGVGVARARGFNPSSLFAGGTVAGAWYDPSDLSTMFDSSAGTTPVAMPGQGAAVPVGLMLDKSQGLVLGPELISGAASAYTGNGTVSTVGDTVTATCTTSGVYGIRWNASTISNIWTRCVFEVVTNSASKSLNFYPNLVHPGVTVGTTTGGKTYTLLAPTASGGNQVPVFFINGLVGESFSIRATSIRELPGNHAIAFNNTTARPELRARVNLLTYSEGFDNAAWVKPIVSVSVNQNAVGPNGVPNSAATLTAVAGTGNHWLYQSFAASATAYTCSVYAKAGTSNWIGLGFGAGATLDGVFFNLSTGTVGASAFGSTGTIQDVGNGWYRCVVTRTLLSGTAFGALEIHTANSQALDWNAVGTETIFIWGADLRPTNIGANVPAYQRIADANTYDTSGFPLYLRFDGIDDSMYTPANLNLSGTDKVAVFAGVRKLTDTTGFVAETSSDAAANNGAFYKIAVPSSRWEVGLRGTLYSASALSTYTSPITNVLSTQYDISASGVANEIVPRVNGLTPTRTNFGSDCGTGNFGTYPLFIGSRNNSGFRLNGDFYSLLVVGSAVSAGNISATEQWVAQKTGLVIP